MEKRNYELSLDPMEQIRAMDGAQELFVPVHGHILLYPQEIAIIDHPSFQRLRRVRQLGLAHMVFPGATHTRFEHCVGAVHVAQLIINHVNHNYRKSLAEPARGKWLHSGISFPEARLIRLGALLHDIGHLPYGHTLEDELHHLRPHDGSERLAMVAGKKFEHFHLSSKCGLAALPERPSRGWSLEGLVDALYKPFLDELGVPLSPFTVLTHIVSKAPKEESGKSSWEKIASQIGDRIQLDVCRDVVGNTICADFLDYLFRDWHHIGKPLYYDRRMYQYMEVRSDASVAKNRGAKFVINVKHADKIRHDALTDILELLNARYKLAETVLFHRTKLALTGLLDRCLAEIGGLFQQAGLSLEQMPQRLEELLLDSSDDGLVGILRKMSVGGNAANKVKLERRIKSDQNTVDESADQNPTLYESSSRTMVALQKQMDFVSTLVDRLNAREVYALAYKLKMSDLKGPHNSKNISLQKLLGMYRLPEHRLRFMRGIEQLCGLPLGSVVIYCPHDASMNAKVAKVNLFIQGDVSPFEEYERTHGEYGLTHNALQAQVARFYELWSAHIFVERTCWDLCRMFRGNIFVR